MTILVAYVPRPEGQAALDKGIEIAKRRSEHLVVVNASPGGREVDPSAVDVIDAERVQQLLDRAPVWLLGPGREHWEALQDMGLHTLADLRALPRAGLARRFGAGLLDELDRARGRQADPRRWLEWPATFDSRLELFARAETS